MKVSIRQRSIGHIPALEVCPEKQKNECLPLIVYYHGWQSNKELLLTQARKLAEKNFRVVLPDALNHGERKQPVSKILGMTFFSSIQANLFEFSFIIEYFKKRNLIRGTIGVGGISMGGFTACALLTHHPEIKAGVCAMGTPAITEYRDLLLSHAKEQDRYIPRDFKELTSWVPQYDLSQQAHTLADRSLFFWHGQKDARVPYEPVKYFVKANPELNVQIDFDKEAGHLVVVETMEKIADFFEENMNG